MKTVKIWLSKTFKFRLSLLLINALLGACDKAPEPMSVKVSGPEEVIPYEALGGGKLGFNRENTFFVLDADTKGSWGLSGVSYGGAISPNGKHIAYTSPYVYNTPFDILSYNIETGNIQTISNTEFDCSSPSWTADSQSVLYIVSLPGMEHQIVRQPLTANVFSLISNHKQGEFINSRVSASIHDDLIFSLITFKPSGEGVFGIFTINLNGPQLSQMTSEPAATTLSPAWSPGGDFIACIKTKLNTDYSYARIDVVVMDEHGANPSTIVSFPNPPSTYQGILGLSLSVAWSPDGGKLAFNMYEADGVHVYVVNADGSGLKKVTSQAGGIDSYVSWSK